MSEVHENISSLIAAYAMGAVPEDEIPPIRAHILTCERCFRDAESFARDAAALSELVEPVALPKGFEDRVLARVRSADAAPVRKRWSWARVRGPLLAGAAALVAAIVVIAGISFYETVESQRQYQQIVAALVRDDDSFSLKGAGGAQAVVASTSEGSLLAAVDLGEAPEDRDYQLWLMKDGVPTPADTFDVSGTVVVVESEQDLSGFDGAAVTVEPEGGSKSPTTDPVLTSS